MLVVGWSTVFKCVMLVVGWSTVYLVCHVGGIGWSTVYLVCHVGGRLEYSLFSVSCWW